MTIWEHVKVALLGVVCITAGITGLVAQWNGNDGSPMLTVFWICIGLAAWTRFEAVERRVEELERRKHDTEVQGAPR